MNHTNRALGIPFQFRSNAKCFNARALAHAREELEKTAKSMGYKLDEIFEMRKPRAKVAPKYRNSDDQNQTWTGRGRKPKWVEYALQSGKTLEDLRI